MAREKQPWRGLDTWEKVLAEVQRCREERGGARIPDLEDDWETLVGQEIPWRGGMEEIRLRVYHERVTGGVQVTQVAISSTVWGTLVVWHSDGTCRTYNAFIGTDYGQFNVWGPVQVRKNRRTGVLYCVGTGAKILAYDTLLPDGRIDRPIDQPYSNTVDIHALIDLNIGENRWWKF